MSSRNKGKERNVNRIFINHTHHASERWSETQKAAAQAYGDIVDVVVPDIPADWDGEQVAELVRQYVERLLMLNPAAVLCQGEFTYTYAMVRQLEKAGIPVLAACSVRQTVESTDEAGNTHRISVFKFVRFREYLS